ncbi:MAG: hypothetical protein GC154_06885 [bacterium]|nr:hypothetical protein [bacterium]
MIATLTETRKVNPPLTDLLSQNRVLTHVGVFYISFFSMFLAPVALLNPVFGRIALPLLRIDLLSARLLGWVNPGSSATLAGIRGGSGLIVLLAALIVLYLLPQLVVWLYYRKRYRSLAFCLVVMSSIAIMNFAHERICIRGYDLVRTYTGQTVTLSELTRECGAPLFCGKGFDGLHYAYYSDGENVASVLIENAERAQVNIKTFYWID